MGIEPTSQAWEAGILPMNYTRIGYGHYSRVFWKMQAHFVYAVFFSVWVPK